LFHELASSW